MVGKGSWQMNACVLSLLLKFVSFCACVGFANTVMFCVPATRQVQARSFTLMSESCALM